MNFYWNRTYNMLFSPNAVGLYVVPAAMIYAGKKYLKSTREAIIITVATNILSQLSLLFLKESSYDDLKNWGKFGFLFPLAGSCVVAKILKLSSSHFIYCLGLTYVSTGIYTSIEETFKWNKRRLDF